MWGSLTVISKSVDEGVHGSQLMCVQLFLYNLVYMLHFLFTHSDTPTATHRTKSPPPLTGLIKGGDEVSKHPGVPVSPSSPGKQEQAVGINWTWVHHVFKLVVTMQVY